ncbi:FadR/GntR family transcriptional regulator [Marisediminicola antarctica]|uniref:GntR family transcriptional regulator n=1 Tax=Marisediminicola antarctica TaxID=674079 RepID=A0A7L5ALS5_9MICO|nr:GntR family transcriptional regulator [Marisediminicola antarctica]QHO70775.1 GntR family transcriptional regulator [Marisediminicola antarctica]
MSDPGGELHPTVADDALFRPVRAGNAFEDTVARLLQAIRLGIVAPGEALPPERDLAARFAVSRDTVREAIRSLADAGFVVSKRGRYGGTFVCESLPPRGVANAVEEAAPPHEEITAAEIDDVLGLREILETGGARASAARPLAAAERDMLWTRLQETAASPVGDDYRRLDSRLHLTIAELAGSPSLVPLIADNRTRVNDLLDRIPLLEPNIAHSNQQHQAIVIAILTGDAELAESTMREHLDGSAALLRGFLA